METTTQKYLIAIMAVGHVKTHLERLRRDYGIPEWGKGLDLHITLVRPFMTHRSIAEIGERFVGFRYRTPAFPLELDGLQRFDNEQSVLYVPVAPSPVLMRLQRDLIGALTGIAESSERPFVPHMIISDETTREQVDSYMARLANERIRLSMQCDRFSLLRWDGAWKFTCGFPLQRTGDAK